jgi:hypothetical protein
MILVQPSRRRLCLPRPKTRSTSAASLPERPSAVRLCRATTTIPKALASRAISSPDLDAIHISCRKSPRVTVGFESGWQHSPHLPGPAEPDYPHRATPQAVRRERLPPPSPAVGLEEGVPLGEEEAAEQCKFRQRGAVDTLGVRYLGDHSRSDRGAVHRKQKSQG